MAKLITASVDVTKLDKEKLVKGKKGTYANLTIWLNDEVDQFGNDVSIQQSLSKDEREAGASKIYLGNGKTHNGKAAPQQEAQDNDSADEDLPF